MLFLAAVIGNLFSIYHMVRIMLKRRQLPGNTCHNDNVMATAVVKHEAINGNCILIFNSRTYLCTFYGEKCKSCKHFHFNNGKAAILLVIWCQNKDRHLG